MGYPCLEQMLMQARLPKLRTAPGQPKRLRLWPTITRAMRSLSAELLAIGALKIGTVSNKKGEPLTEVACEGCGRVQRLRKRKIVPCDHYTCGWGGDCVKNPQFSLPMVPEGCIRHHVPNAAGAFNGYSTRFATPEEAAAIARARDILERGRAQLASCR